MATSETTVIDPFDSASDAHALSAEYYGELILDAWHCVLEKGSGKRPFDPQVDDPSTRRTAVDIVVLPLAEANLKFSLERKLLAESKAWSGLTWPSLQRLGLVNAREAKNRFCRVKLILSGRTWIGSDGDKKEETTFEFIELYADELACKAAYATKKGGHSPAAASPAIPAQPTAADELARKTALTFAKAIVINLARSENDPLALQLKVAEKIAAMPLVGKYFTAETPEVLQLIAEALVAA